MGYRVVTDRQTDRQTDGRTDVQPISITCFSIADARKNLLYTKVRYCSVVSESVVICQLALKMPEEIDFEN